MDTPTPDGVTEKMGAMNVSGPVKIASPDEFPDIVRKLALDDDAVVLEATLALRKALSVEHSPPLQAAIDAGAVLPLVELAKRDDATKIQFEALWALTNIASGESTHTQHVIDAGGVDLAVNCLGVPTAEVVEQAAWMLGNIAGDGPVARDLVLAAGVVEPLTRVLSSSSRMSLIRNATWTASNLCRGKPKTPLSAIVRLVPVLATLLRSGDVETQTDAAWALSYVSDGENDRIQAVLEAGAVPSLIKLMQSTHKPLVVPALRCLGNIVTGDDMQTQAVLDAGALPHLAGLVRDGRGSIRKEACWAFSNITAGTREQIQAVIDSGVVPSFVAALGDEPTVQKEAMWALANLTSGGSPEQIRFAVAAGMLAPTCAVLAQPDPRVQMVALEALHNTLRSGAGQGDENPYKLALEESGALDALEALQTTSSEDVYQKVVGMLGEFFEFEEDDEDDEPSANPVAVHPAQQQVVQPPAGGAFAAPAFSFPDDASDDDEDLVG